MELQDHPATAATITVALIGRDVLSSLLCCDHEVSEIGRFMSATFHPKDEQFASIFGGVRSVHVACLEVQRSPSLILLSSLVKSPSTTYSASAMPLWRWAGTVAPGLIVMVLLC